MEPVLVNLMQSFDIMTNAQNMLREKCISGIIANEERCKEYAERSIGIITALNPHIGYEKSCAIAREALLENKSVRELILKYKIMDEDKLNKILDPYEMTNIGIAGKDLLEQ